MYPAGHTYSARVRFARLAALGIVPLALLLTHGNADAQIAGTTNRPLPNVLLLVDSSGSMERMPDNSLPSQNRNPANPPSFTFVSGPTNQCQPGVASNPNRWGMLLQAMTGNLQPFFSCAEVNRSTPAFQNEFKINNVNAYDYQYFLPYHRPLAGNGAPNACAFAPYTLPGASMGSGVGPGLRGAGGNSRDMPADSFVSVLNNHLSTRYAGNNPLISELTMAPAGNGCIYDQANDGQLDATRDYIRFALMTFDNATESQTGVLGAGPVGGNVDTANPFLGQWTYAKSPANPTALGFGRPAGCLTAPTPFDVGARHWAAPPWEGRMVPFANPDGNLFDIQRTNDEIQQVLLATRPYGATPIDGMMEDARDYLWYNDYGPLGTQTGYRDNYVGANCRDQYIILLTDGAPNLDLRPSCGTGGGSGGGVCPYPYTSAQVADQMAQAPGNRRVQTFVIGFSVNGATNSPADGFPAPFNTAPNNNCKAWYNSFGSSGAMQAACSTTPPPVGSTAEACCKLNEIAYFGSTLRDTGPFFAETQADLVLSFGRILGNVSKTATTRTIPGYSPPVSIASVARNAQFIASFIPNAQKVWSGEIDRTRNVCSGPTALTQPQTTANGDSMAANLAAQAGSNRRLFLSVEADPIVGPTGNRIDSQRTIRPLMSAHGSILPAHANDVAMLGGTPKAGIGMTLASSLNIDAFGITSNTCKRSRDVLGVTIPALTTASECADVVWRFASASTGNPAFGGYSGWNVRCRGGASATAGTCSVSGTGCAMLTGTCPVVGEVCVPECAALGAIYRSSPTLVGAPGELLRDEAYRRYSDQRSKRRPAMFVSSTDGVLHAFKALAGPDFLGDTAANEHELWAFVPPAVLPRLASNYPTGQQILLDGTPAVADIVWDRRLGDPLFSAPEQFHTTLASGMGAGGGGYFALNVSDVDCQGNTGLGIGGAPQGCLPAYTPETAYLNIRANPKGPSFLWQITDIEALSPGEKAKITRTAPNGTQMVSLFGKESGNPVITTLNVDPDGGGARQIGVVILPGGIDGAPSSGPPGQCRRAVFGGGPTAFPIDADASDPGRKPRQFVRQWGTGGANPCRDAPVPGRSVTIVRADTGAIIRHFGRIDQDTPQRLRNRTIDAPFDSPIIGTPAIYPNQTGIATQKAYVGDADGTLWRLDLSSSNPAQWRVQLFQDLVSVDHIGAPGAAQSQPIQVPPLVTLDPFGNTVVIATTGDQENIVFPAPPAPDRNYLFSVQETRSSSATALGVGSIRWFRTFTGGQRVTGPMTVFDRTLYFSTYTPIIPNSASCDVGGNPLLWGQDFFNPEGGAALGGLGGIPRWCPLGSVDAVTGACTAPAPLPASQDPSAGPFGDPQLRGAIIAGVTIRSSLPCVQSTGGTDPAITGMSTTKYDLFFGATTRGAGGAGTGTPQAARPAAAMTRPLPRTTANIDAWSLVTD